MSRYNRDYVDAYIGLIREDPARYAKDYLKYKEAIARSRAIYMGEPVPGLYQGIFYDEQTFASWERIANTMISIGEKMTRAYLDNASYRALFPFPKEMEKLILHDPGYDMAVPVARYDLFYEDEEHFMFCECNTDGSSAMNEDNVLGRLLLESEGMRDFSDQYILHNRDYFDPWVEKSLDLYQEIKGELPKTIAIADFKESGTPYEFLEFQERYEKKGIPTFLPDIRELAYKDGALYFGNEKIDMVYRRVTTSELVEKAEEAKGFIDAYYANAFVCIGSMRSQVIHNKKAFEILHDPDWKHLFTAEENAFIEKHIPYTGSLTEETREKVLANKDRYIIKPADSRGSAGVAVGADWPEDAFSEKIDELLGGAAIYQDYYVAEPMDFVYFDEEGNFSVQPLVPLYGMFIYAGDFAGVYTRVGGERIISGKTSYFVAPNLEVKPRGESGDSHTE